MHTPTAIDPLVQGIEIQSVIADDDGELAPGHHELVGYVQNNDGEYMPITIALVPSAVSNFGQDGHDNFVLDEEMAVANLKRLAHCWNCHDELVASLADLLGEANVNTIAAAKAALAAADQELL